MATKIGEYKGYTILYDSQSKVFRLENAQGEEVGSGATQEAVETQADALSKTRFPFPIRVFDAQGRDVRASRITSVNLKEVSVWVVEEEMSAFGYKQRQKRNIGYSPNLYERTEANEQIAATIKVKKDAITQLETEIKELIATLEKPITPAYFGIK